MDIQISAYQLIVSKALANDTRCNLAVEDEKHPKKLRNVLQKHSDSTKQTQTQVSSSTK